MQLHQKVAISIIMASSLVSCVGHQDQENLSTNPLTIKSQTLTSEGQYKYVAGGNLNFSTTQEFDDAMLDKIIQKEKGGDSFYLGVHGGCWLNNGQQVSVNDGERLRSQDVIRLGGFMAWLQNFEMDMLKKSVSGEYAGVPSFKCDKNYCYISISPASRNTKFCYVYFEDVSSGCGYESPADIFSATKLTKGCGAIGH